MKDNRNQWGGSFQIVKIKPHNTVEIKTGLKTNVLVHVKNLKPFEGSNSRNFSSNFQKQGGDANNFDHSGDEDEDEKFERRTRRTNDGQKNSTRRMTKTKQTKVPQTQNQKMKNVK